MTEGDIMSALNVQITDMAGAYIEHSMVISNFLIKVDKTVIPDASINCRFRNRRGNSFFNNPRFVMEVLSPSTESYDRGEKMELYRIQEIDEYWIVDWRKKQVEIYVLDYEQNIPKYYLFHTITEKNKEDLRIVHFPNVKMTFDELFNGIEYAAEDENIT